MAKKELESPQVKPWPAPDPGGELGTGLDLDSQPSERISAHNVYSSPDKGSFTGKGKSEIVSPVKTVKPIKVDE